MTRLRLTWAAVLFVIGAAVFVPARLYATQVNHCYCNPSCLFGSCFCSATGGVVHCNCGCTWYGAPFCSCSEP
jgi:hypothetical protein